MLELYKEKNRALLNKIAIESDPLKRVDYEIQQFYTEDTIELIEKQNNMIKATVYLTKDEANKQIDNKTKKYNRIIGLLELKVSLLENKISTLKDELEVVETKLLIADLKAEIQAKKSFVEAWIERKKVV